MSVAKRKRDTEYQYDDSASRETHVQASPENVQGSHVPSPGSLPSGHVDSLLAQARQAGLLPSNGGTVLPTVTGSIPLNHRTQRHQGGVYPSRPQSSNYSDPRRQQPKRKKVEQGVRNTPLTSKNKQNKRKPVAKPGQKAPGFTAVDNNYVKGLVAEALSQQMGPTIPSQLSLPSFSSIAKPADYPPPLPPIHDKKLEQQCFTHPSYIHDPMNKSKSVNSLHYERLEFLGDSYMNYCVTKILYNRLPDLREGVLTRFRSQIISNDNIRHYALMYGFNKRILLSAGAERDEVRDAGKKVADIFEAYIGGILTDQPSTGERTVFEWMKAITAPQLEHAVKIAGYLVDINRNAKQELYVLIDAEKLPAPVYVVTREGGTNLDFEVACLVQGKEMGRGIGKNKNEAGIRAATQVLEKLKATTANRREKEAREKSEEGKEQEQADEGKGKGGEDGNANEASSEDGQDPDSVGNHDLVDPEEGLSEGEIMISRSESDRS